MITRRTTLSHNIIAFCRFLRENGMGVGPDEEATASTQKVFRKFDTKRYQYARTHH
jgi:uncharacterized protein with von Willebrand factor type A (vWA) domain